MGNPIEPSDAGGATESEVRAWLDRNGYRLEMKVAQSLIPLADTVEQGGQYIDAASGQVRAFDVRAQWTVIGSEFGIHFYSFVVECKNTQAPWVVFAGGADWTWDTSLPEHGVDSTCGVCVDLGEGVIAEAVRNIDSWGYAITEKRNADKGSGRDHARDGVLSAASAACSIVEAFRRLPPAALRDPDSRYHDQALAVPLVVTTSPLFACSLDARGEIHLEEVEIARVAVRPYPEMAQVPVVIARPGAFEAFASTFTRQASGALGEEWDRGRGGRAWR